MIKEKMAVSDSKKTNDIEMNNTKNDRIEVLDKVEKIDIKQAEAPVKAPQDFTDVDALYKELIDSIKKYHPSDDLSMVEKAYHVAKRAHEGQVRKSGEPYLIHPICVGIILAELELDKETIVAGILHDVVEDTTMTLDDVKREFSTEIAQLVDGVTKLTQLSLGNKDKIEVQAENLRKMFLAMASDIRVILIKLADRLHNMRTLKYMSPEKQKEKARETMDIYAPIAHRLGISKIKTELDDLSLKYLEPEKYEDLVEKIEKTRNTREKFVQEIIDEIYDYMKKTDIPCKITGRVKHLFSIYKKMVNQHKDLDQIYDLFAVRIIVNSVKDCYAVLGIIHELYHPISGRFKDYIAMPKANMYQSLHTTLVKKTNGEDSQPFEIQIRTVEMHKTSEYGIAAHWKYKESGSGKLSAKDEEAKLSWLREILEWQKNNDSKEFMSMLKNDLDLFSDSVYCFSPSGDVKNLPKGSTPIDFAYSVHSAVGNKMVGCRVNDKIAPIDYEIQNGDRIEIITSQNSRGPSRDWLKIVRSTRAKNKINQWFKQEYKEDNITRGRDLLDKYCKAKGIVQTQIQKPEFMEKVVLKYNFRNWDAVLAAIGHGGLKEGQVINKLQEEYRRKNKPELKMIEATDSIEAADVKEYIKQGQKTKSGITVKGIDDLAVRFSHCCSPVPGDEIIGFITRGRGISIHRTDCQNIISLSSDDRKRLISADWEKEAIIDDNKTYATEISIYARNRVGIFQDISKIFTERNMDITSMNVRTGKDGMAKLIMSFNISGVEQLNTIINKINMVSDVVRVER